MVSARSGIAREYFTIAAVVSVYWVVSISLVFINKYLLSGKDLQLDAPLFVTWFQCVVTVLLCIFLTLLSRCLKRILGKPVFTFAAVGVSLNELRQVLPVSVVFVCMISFNNLCLKYVDVSFYYIGRSLTTVFNVALSYALLNQKQSGPALICCGVIVGGFFLGVDQEKIGGSLSVIGVVFGVLASLFVALNSIYIKKVLNVVRGDVSLLTYYNNINACLIFPPIFLLLGEGTSLMAFQHYDDVKFWGPMLFGGIFGFAIGYLTTLQVKVTSPLTNNISGTAKACAQTVIASTYYHEVRPPLWWASNVVVLAGSAFYTRVKQLEMAASYQQQDNKDPASQVEDKIKLLSNEDDDELNETVIMEVPPKNS
ncbi:hypothetical protein CHUAL_013762 [Chamberlinius hualienensis]